MLGWVDDRPGKDNKRKEWNELDLFRDQAEDECIKICPCT